MKLVTGQLSFQRHSGWGGKRKNAGRRPEGVRAGVSHATRPTHHTAHPVHATLRALAVVGSLRDCPVFNALEAALAAAASDAFRVVHYSIQHDHLHLIVEAHERTALIRGLQGLAIRTARAINRAARRRGKVWADRYHARALRTPREVRNALVYVLCNWKKTVRGAERLDPCATGFWFDGWRGPRPRWSLPPEGEAPPVRAARTWLLTTGWRHHGLIGFDERPLPDPRRPRATAR
jgi:REP element-mobilizing transposase RayT